MHSACDLVTWTYMYMYSSITCIPLQGDLVLNLSELVIEFVLKLALNTGRLEEIVEIDPSNTSVWYFLFAIACMFVHHNNKRTRLSVQTHMIVLVFLSLQNCSQSTWREIWKHHFLTWVLSLSSVHSLSVSLSPSLSLFFSCLLQLSVILANRSYTTYKIIVSLLTVQ